MTTSQTDEGLYDYALREPRLPRPENRDNDRLDIPLERRLEFYETQQLLRQFEKRAYDLFMQNLVKGTSHLSLGMEAVATGFGQAMRPDDYSFATYRGHAHTLARGAEPGPVLAELLGREMSMPSFCPMQSPSSADGSRSLPLWPCEELMFADDD